MAREIVVVRCNECEEKITNGQTCLCEGIVIGYGGDIYSGEGVYYSVESRKKETSKRGNMD